MFKYLRQLASETFVYGIAWAAARFQAIILLPVYTRVFDPAEYGVMSLVITAMTLVSIFAVLGLDSAALRWYWDTEDTADRKGTMASWAWCQIAVSSALAFLVAISSGWLGEILMDRVDAGVYFRLAAIALPLSVLGSVVAMWFRVQRRPWAMMVYGLGTNLFNILTTILLVVVLRQGLRGVFLAQIISAGASMVLAAFVMGNWVNPDYFRWHRLREMLTYALPLVPAALAFWVVNLSDRYFVQFFTTTSEVGLYQVGSTLAAVIALGTHAFQQAWPPFAMSIYRQADARAVYANVFLAYLGIACLVTTGLTLVSPVVLRVVATERYVEASSVVGFLALAYVMVGLRYIAAIGPAIVKKTWPVGAAAAIGALLNVATNLLLVPSFGKVGAAIATLLSQSAVVAYLFYRSAHLYAVPYRFGSGLGIVALSFVLMWLGSGWQFDRWWAGLLAKLGLLSLFIPGLFFLRVITPAQALRVLRPLAAQRRSST